MKKILSILLFFISVVAYTQSTYYVATTGSDAGAGTIGDPFETITYAISQMSGGDTIYVRGGTYNERVYPYHKDGSANTRTYFSTYDSETVIIDGTGIVIPAGSALIYLHSKYTTFTGFEVKNVNMNAEGDGDYGITTSDYDNNVTVSYCTVGS